MTGPLSASRRLECIAPRPGITAIALGYVKAPGAAHRKSQTWLESGRNVELSSASCIPVSRHSTFPNVGHRPRHRQHESKPLEGKGNGSKGGLGQQGVGPASAIAPRSSPHRSHRLALSGSGSNSTTIPRPSLPRWKAPQRGGPWAPATPDSAKTWAGD